MLTSLVANGGNMIALRVLAHGIAEHTARADRCSDAQWLRWRFQNTRPAGAESAIMQELLAPFLDLAQPAA